MERFGHEMADHLLFDEFRARVERRSSAPGQFDIRSVEGTCRWVSASGVFGSGQYCFGAKKRKDTTELLYFFSEHDAVDSLRDFPEHLCDVAFCELHSAAAKPLCKDGRFYGSNANAIVKTQIGDEEKQLVLWEPVQLLRFEDDGTMHVAMGDKHEGGTGLEVVFHQNERVFELLPNDTNAIAECENKTSLGNDQDPQAKIGLDNVKDEQGVEGKYSSPRAKMSRSSRSQDNIHKVDVAKAEHQLLDLMQGDINVRHEKPGYVYAFRDPEINLIKFGSTGQFITTRLGGIQNACKPGQPLDIVAGLHLEHFSAYEVLEKLLHKYLQPHRWYFDCIHGKKTPTSVRHHEYFDIPDEEARHVFSVWRDFMSLSPFHCPNSPKWWSLKPHWMIRVKNVKSPPEHETHKDHMLKLKRWEKVLRDPEKDLTRLEKASGVRETSSDIKIPVGKLSFSTSALSKSERSQSASRELLPSSSKIKSELAANPTPTRFSLGIPDTLLTSSRSAPSTPMLRGVDSKANNPGGSVPETKSTLLADPRSTQNAHVFKFFGKKPAQATAALPEETSARLVARPVIDTTPLSSVPTGAFLFETPTPSQRKSAKSEDASVPQIKLESESPSPENEQGVPGNDSKTTINEMDTDIGFGIDWNARYRELEKVLLREREGLPSRTISQDLVQFRWPLSFAIFLAAYSSYAPSLLTTITWSLFLPCLVAELRSWFPELAHR